MAPQLPHNHEAEVAVLRSVMLRNEAMGSLTLAPGGYHVMFVGLKAALPQGGKLPATLTFRKGAATFPVAVTFNVDPPPEEHKH